MISTERRISVALWHANAELRSNDRATKQHHRNQFCDLIEAADYPRMVLHETVRRLGRQRAMAMEIDRRTINLACKQPKIFEGRL